MGVHQSFVYGNERSSGGHPKDGAVLDLDFALFFREMLPLYKNMMATRWDSYSSYYSVPYFNGAYQHVRGGGWASHFGLGLVRLVQFYASHTMAANSIAKLDQSTVALQKHDGHPNAPMFCKTQRSHEW